MRLRFHLCCILLLLLGAAVVFAAKPSYLAEVDEERDRRSAEEVLTEEGLILSSEGSPSKENPAESSTRSKPLKHVALPKKNLSKRAKRQTWPKPPSRREGVVTNPPLEESDENSHVHIKYENGTGSEEAGATTRQYRYHFAKPSAAPVDEVIEVGDDTGHKDPVLHTLPPRNGETTPYPFAILAVPDETYEEPDEDDEQTRSDEAVAVLTEEDGPGTRHTRTVPTLTPEPGEDSANPGESEFGPLLSVSSAEVEGTSTVTDDGYRELVQLEEEGSGFGEQPATGAAPKLGDQQTLPRIDEPSKVPPTPVPQRDAQPAYLQGPKGDKGDRGERGDPGPPGVCSAQCAYGGGGSLAGPQGPPGQQGPPGTPGPKGEAGLLGAPGLPGPMGPPGRFDELNDIDLERIAQRVANYPGIKGEKGDRVSQDDTRSYELETNSLDDPTSLPAYRSGSQRYNEPRSKGEKGDRGVPGHRGPTGPPGPPGPAGPPGRDGAQAAYSPVQASGGGVAIYQTTVELFGSSHAVGTLAFSVSSQELFLKVLNGWHQIQLGAFYPSRERAPSMAHTEERYQLPPTYAPRPYTFAPPFSPPTTHWAPEQPQAEPLGWRPQSHPRDREVPRKSPPSRMVTPPAQTWKQARALHLVALSEPLNGDMSGTGGIDARCHKEAGLNGWGNVTFRAFLSSPRQDINKIPRDEDKTETPVVNLFGEKLFDSWNALYDSDAHWHVPLYSFDGRNVLEDSRWPEKFLWHGSNHDGNRVHGAFCSGVARYHRGIESGEWRSSLRSHYGMASPLSPRRSLTHAPQRLSCDRQLVVLCVEVVSKYHSNRLMPGRVNMFG